MHYFYKYKVYIHWQYCSNLKQGRKIFHRKSNLDNIQEVYLFYTDFKIYNRRDVYIQGVHRDAYKSKLKFKVEEIIRN